MDVFHNLVRQVSRSFYEPEYIIVMDYLLRNRVISDVELARNTGFDAREVNKIAAVLVNHKLVKVYERNELKEGATRSTNRRYYYIDYRHFRDVVKWRIIEMRRLIVEKDLHGITDAKGYVCPRCGAGYTALDVDRLLDRVTGSFVCEICSAELDNENGKRKGDGDRMLRFNTQTYGVREGLRKTEGIVFPVFDVEKWIRDNLDEARQSGANDRASGEQMNAI